ncbi:hypothetical protein [Paracoccus cavernae]
MTVTDPEEPVVLRADAPRAPFVVPPETPAPKAPVNPDDPGVSGFVSAEEFAPVRPDVEPIDDDYLEEMKKSR